MNVIYTQLSVYKIRLAQTNGVLSNSPVLNPTLMDVNVLFLFKLVELYGHFEGCC